MATSETGFVINSETPAGPSDHVDWSSAFRTPQFLTGLQTAVAQALQERSFATTTLDQDDVPSRRTSSHTTTGNTTVAEGMFSSPSFVTVTSSMLSPRLARPPHSDVNLFPSVNPSTYTLPLCPSLGIEKAFSLAPGRAPIPGKLVTKILSNKFVDLAELLPENLDEPMSDTTSFTIEGSTIVPASKPNARHKKEITGILSWIECFTGYTSVFAAFRPHRARDLLAYIWRL